MSPKVVSIRVLLGTWIALALLTAVTVAVARVDLGPANLAAALGIASLKAALVAMFFMHLWYGGRFNLVVLVTSVFFAAVLAVFVVYDTRAYQPSIREKAAVTKAVQPGR